MGQKKSGFRVTIEAVKELKEGYLKLDVSRASSSSSHASSKVFLRWGSVTIVTQLPCRNVAALMVTHIYQATSNAARWYENAISDVDYCLI